jgi:HEAT repeat protein
MKTVPRRRFITIVCLITAVLVWLVACLMVNRSPPEASFKGRPASYWLGEVFGGRGQQGEALEAFHQMGTNAEPVLVAAIEARENPFARMYRRICHYLPGQMRWNLPDRENPLTLRSAAGYVAQNFPSHQLAAKLLPLLKEPDSDLRLNVLYAVNNQIGPADAWQIPFVLSATNDPDEFVRMSAAFAMWKINGETNNSVPMVDRVLHLGQDAGHRHWAARYLLEMGQVGPLLTTTFIQSLANSDTGVRQVACVCLGQIGPPAAAAIPALRKALLDPDLGVRQGAKTALRKIEPQKPNLNPR